MSDSHQRSKPSGYIGRFAPSPTGPLHAGSMIAALASFLDARSQGGRWLVRMEDLDPPRETPEAARSILKTLEQTCLHWDDNVVFQSQRHRAYEEALQQLTRRGLSFKCDCSRRDIQAHGGIYPGTCRNRRSEPPGDYAIRCRVEPALIQFEDLYQGRQQVNSKQDVGDFVILRKDGLFAYQLAVAVDDAWQRISHVIRGTDLLESTFRQLYIQQQLGLGSPRYGHIPVIINNSGQKLSKQHFAPAVDSSFPERILLQSLRYLLQNPDPELDGCHCEDILEWAIHHWNPSKFSGLQEIHEFVPAD